MTTTRLEKLITLAGHARVTHPDRIKGCMFSVNIPPGYTINAWSPWKHEVIEGVTHTGISQQPYVVEWDDRTRDYLNNFKETFKQEHWSIDFCMDAWESWQAGEWKEEER